MLGFRYRVTACILVTALLCLFCIPIGSSSASPADLHWSNGGNNWAVLVCSSPYWYNYRHVANTLSVYHTVKRLGIPDSQIILMLADDVACNPRNCEPAAVYNSADSVSKKIGLYDSDVEVDYRGYEVSVESFIRVMTGRHEQHVPRSKRLLTDERSNVLVYLTGHGGDGFLKFQDSEELTSTDMASIFTQMWTMKRYNEVLFVVDTCQAGSMGDELYSVPNVVFIGGARVGQDSLSHGYDSKLGIALIDGFTHTLLQQMERITPHSSDTLDSLIWSIARSGTVGSTPFWHESNKNVMARGIDEIKVVDFFSSVAQVTNEIEIDVLCENSTL